MVTFFYCLSWVSQEQLVCKLRCVKFFIKSEWAQMSLSLPVLFQVSGRQEKNEWVLGIRVSRCLCSVSSSIKKSLFARLIPQGCRISEEVEEKSLVILDTDWYFQFQLSEIIPTTLWFQIALSKKEFRYKIGGSREEIQITSLSRAGSLYTTHLKTPFKPLVSMFLFGASQPAVLRLTSESLLRDDSWQGLKEYMV